MTLPDCSLRIAVPDRPGRKPQYRCSGGLNFFALGPDAALCQRCRVPTAGLEAVLQCPYSDIYTYIRTLPGQEPMVNYDIRCFAEADQPHCALCPDVHGLRITGETADSRNHQ